MDVRHLVDEGREDDKWVGRKMEEQTSPFRKQLGLSLPHEPDTWAPATCAGASSPLSPGLHGPLSTRPPCTRVVARAQGQAEEGDAAPIGTSQTTCTSSVRVHLGQSFSTPGLFLLFGGVSAPSASLPPVCPALGFSGKVSEAPGWCEGH